MMPEPEFGPLCLMLAIGVLGQLDAIALDTVNSPDVATILADNFHMLFDFIHAILP